ncbi:kinase-like domain-containing protein [Gilbertella persicaria]|uniref:kinase-like domain-containing protein n=1 Tax=Gilbertella persicaria TaxID=101096 RepID=UPI00221EB59B|nr:kinase-like domain-containing protein [Gilbertella persicaria]KAI8077942.1 kinase-like domain-containing protein [Gilbertella persicaria]
MTTAALFHPHKDEGILNLLQDPSSPKEKDDNSRILIQTRTSEEEEEEEDEIKSSNTHQDTIVSAEEIHTYSKNYEPKKISRLGPFLLLKTLGVGEFGKVKLGKHIETGQMVAVKLVKKENIDSSSQLDKIRMEIDILKTLNHPYIVKLLSVNETNTSIGMVLEYAEGGELFEYIYRQRYLKENEARRIFSQLISSVYYMHQKNIVHRDLKLENILLDRQHNIIVTDFGFANQFTPKTGDWMSTSCGSPVYAAPELVMTGRLYAGTGVDIWSCGIILYAMLCGYLPFDDDVKNPNSNNIGRLYRYIMSHKPKYPPHLSDDAKDIIGKMLVPIPNERCDIKTIMNHVWLQKYQSDIAESVETFEQEATIRKLSLLKGIESTTHLSISENQTQSDCDNESCSSVSSSYSYPLSFTQNEDHVIEEQEHHEPTMIVGNDNDDDQEVMPSDNVKAAQGPEQELILSDNEGKDQLTNIPVQDTKANKTIPPLSATKTTSESNAIDAVVTNVIIPPEQDEEKQQLQQPNLSLRAKLFSSMKRRSVGTNNAPIKTTSTPPLKDKPVNKTRHSWQMMVHRSTTKEALPPITPPASPILVEHSKSERLISWLKKSKPQTKNSRTTNSSNNSSKSSHSSSAKIAMIPEEESTIPIARPMRSTSAQVKRTPTSLSLQRKGRLHKEKQQNIDNLSIESELRVHKGAMNRSVLTSKPPMDVLLEITKVLLILGIEVENVGGYKLHCTRRAEPQQSEMKDTMDHLSTNCNDTASVMVQPVYGHPSIDTGDEIRFSVEICRFENLSGLFSVDIQRLSKGNFSGYQFIGQKLLSLLHFGEVIRNTNFNISLKKESN